MLRSLISRVRPRHLVLPAAVYLLSAVLMFGRTAGSLAAVSRACRGMAPFDVRGWWALHDAQAMRAACGAAGRTAYIHQQLLDLVYPAALAAFLLVVTALLLRAYGPRWWPILLPTLAMTVCDYTENIGVWTLLLDWGHTHPAVVAVAGSATAAKRVLGTIAYTIPVALAAVRASSAIQRRRRRQRPVLDTGKADRDTCTPVASTTS